LVSSGIDISGGTVDAELELLFHRSSYQCLAKLRYAGAALSLHDFNLAPRDHTEVELEYVQTDDFLKVQSCHLRWGEVDLHLREDFYSPTRYSMEVAGQALPAQWLRQIAAGSLAEWQFGGTFGGDFKIVRQDDEENMLGTLSLDDLNIAWRDVLQKAREVPFNVVLDLTRTGEEIDIRQLRVGLGSGEISVSPMPDNGWQLELCQVSAEQLNNLSPVLRRQLASADLRFSGPVSGELRLQDNVSGDLQLSHTQVDVGGVFVKPRGVLASCKFRIRTSASRPVVELRDWKVGHSGGSFLFKPETDGWQVDVSFARLDREDLFKSLPGLRAGPLRHLDWEGAISGQLVCRSREDELQYRGKLNGDDAFIAWKDWWRKPVDLPLTVEYVFIDRDERFYLEKFLLTLNQSRLGITGGFDRRGDRFEFTIGSEACTPQDLWQTVAGLGENFSSLGDWQGAFKGICVIKGNPEQEQYNGSLDLAGLGITIEDKFYKQPGWPSSLNFSIEAPADRIRIRRCDLSLNHSRAWVNGEVFPEEQYRVDLGLRTDLYAPEVETYIPNLADKRIVGYPAPTLLRALSNREERIDLEWQVQGTFADPEFEVQVRQALRAGIDMKLRQLGLLVGEGVGAVFKLGGAIIRAPFQILGIITNRERNVEHHPHNETEGDTEGR